MGTQPSTCHVMWSECDITTAILNHQISWAWACFSTILQKDTVQLFCKGEVGSVLKLISPYCRVYASVNQVSIGSDNGLSPVWRQAIILTNAGLLSIEPLGTNFSYISLKIQYFSFMKMHLKLLSAIWWPFCPGGDELRALSWIHIWH